MKAIKFVLVSAILMTAMADCLAGQQAASGEKTNRQIIVQGNNEFALEIYTKLQSQEGNLFFSPYSISTAMAMAYAGARGRTESQIAKVLHFPAVVNPATESIISLSPDRTHFASEFGKIINDLNNRGKKGNYELNVAKALWGQKGYEFLEEFLRIIDAGYGGQFNDVDFIRATEAARKNINSWVEKKTNNKIKNLIGKGVLDSMTRLVLTNAIYFKGNWASQFKEDRTENAPFTLTDGKKIDIPMMNQSAKFGYMETETFQGLDLPYVNNELSMFILLPKQPDGLKELETTLTYENLSLWISKHHKQKVVVSIPKFKMTSQFSLVSVLKSMGIEDAFSSDADFSGINGKRDLFISAVIHKAYVDVNEEGTEAAAATAVTMRLTSVGPTQIPVFRADHPFLFLIRDNKTGSILFIGRVMDPKT